MVHPGVDTWRRMIFKATVTRSAFSMLSFSTWSYQGLLQAHINEQIVCIPNVQLIIGLPIYMRNRSGLVITIPQPPKKSNIDKQENAIHPEKLRQTLEMIILKVASQSSECFRPEAKVCMKSIADTEDRKEIEKME